MRGVRKLKKAEREYDNRAEVQSCRMCGRLFVRRKGDVCSISCMEKAAELDKKSAWRGD
jgi:hypothetical protein